MVNGESRKLTFELHAKTQRKNKLLKKASHQPGAFTPLRLHVKTTLHLCSFATLREKNSAPLPLCFFA
jgi:hypothetical protein